MLHTQFYSATSGFGALGDAASVKAMQETLRRLGRGDISVSGTVDGPTAAAVYELIRDNVSLIPKIPSSVKTIFDKLKSFDSTIRQYTFGKFDSSSLIRYSTTVISAVRAISSTVANAMQTGLNEFYSAINATAPALNVAFNILAPTSPTSTPTPTTLDINKLTAIMSSIVPIKATMATSTPSSSQSYPAGTIYAYSVKLGRYRIAVPRMPGMAGFGIAEAGVFGDCVFGDCGLGADAAYTEVAPSASPPPGGTATTESDLEKKTGTQPWYKKPLVLAAIAGGVAVVGGGSYFLVRRKRSA